MTSVISEVATPKGQTKSNRLARLSHDLKICAKFPVFLTVINRRGGLHSQRPTSIKA